MKKYSFFVAIILILSCKNDKNKPSEILTKSTVTINLPFESANYENDINFVLYDSLDKKCIAELDTVTKGGGTIIYEDLPNGTYKYSIKTIFNENITKQLKIDSSVYINFYAHCYDVKDVIEFDSIRTAEKINLLIETLNEQDNGERNAIEVKKTGNKYLLKYHFEENNDWSKPSFIDSIKLITALTEFETTVIGLREMAITEENYGYTASTSVYFKCDNEYLEVWNIKSGYLKSALKKLKEALLK